MEKACFQQLHHVRVEQNLHDLLGLVLGSTLFRELLPRKPLLDQDFPRGFDDLRHHHSVSHQLTLGDELGKLSLVVRLKLVVKFLNEGRRGSVHQLKDALELARVALDRHIGAHGGQLPHHEEVQGHLFAHVGSLHLDSNLPALDLGAVDLTHGCRGHRLVEGGHVIKKAAHHLLPAQVATKGLHGLLPTKGAHPLQQPLELLLIGLRQGIRPGCKNLHDLHKRRAQVGNELLRLSSTLLGDFFLSPQQLVQFHV
mmetsp:Transcript_37618/g.86892  ORF Transcript_37618/g.86892 Transcript_37618/m.86892 type:complete len:255 (+) Transcript_37618:1172-1936(+)